MSPKHAGNYSLKLKDKVLYNSEAESISVYVNCNIAKSRDRIVSLNNVYA